jgi:hypothetical protein
MIKRKKNIQMYKHIDGGIGIAEQFATEQSAREQSPRKRIRGSHTLITLAESFAWGREICASEVSVAN